jgi:hypothetical protein
MDNLPQEQLDQLHVKMKSNGLNPEFLVEIQDRKTVIIYHFVYAVLDRFRLSPSEPIPDGAGLFHICLLYTKNNNELTYEECCAPTEKTDDNPFGRAQMGHGGAFCGERFFDRSGRQWW